MKFRSIEKRGGGEYLNRYDVHYETPSGGEKVYEMFSRDPGIDSADKLLHPRTDAVMIIMTDEAREHLLLIREFRLELGREIYGLPAGLIDPGETPESAARRELRIIYGVLALLWVPAIALDLTERVSGANMLWVWCALLVVCAPLAWRAWRIERDYDLRVTREVARFIETGELPTGNERPRGHRVLGFIGVVVVFLLVDALLDVIF